MDEATEAPSLNWINQGHTVYELGFAFLILILESGLLVIIST